MVKCIDCEHLKHRYTIFFDKHYPELRQELQRILDSDEPLQNYLLCEGVGCRFQDGAIEDPELEFNEEDCIHFKRTATPSTARIKLKP